MAGGENQIWPSVVVKRIETYIKQLKGYAYTGKRDQAIELVARIRECIELLGRDLWAREVNQAAQAVMEKRPEPKQADTTAGNLFPKTVATPVVAADVAPTALPGVPQEPPPVSAIPAPEVDMDLVP